jgi:hypothetical protein
MLTSSTTPHIPPPPRAHEALEAEDDPYAPRSRSAERNWAAEDSETRFETESDVMELCDLAETL